MILLIGLGILVIVLFSLLGSWLRRHEKGPPPWIGNKNGFTH